MNHSFATIYVINHAYGADFFGPTLPIAIKHCLPHFATTVGDSRAVLGIRPYGPLGRSYHGYGLVIETDDNIDRDHPNRYRTRKIAIPNDIEAFNVWKELNEIERGLRYFAQDQIHDPKFHARIVERGIEWVEAVNQVLIFDPKAKIDLSVKLEEIFDGADWKPWMKSLPFDAPTVMVRDVEIVEREEDTLFLRFQYSHKRSDGSEIGNLELEFVDLFRGKWKVRSGLFSALRGLDPAFNGWQLPQVYSELQRDVDAMTI